MNAPLGELASLTDRAWLVGGAVRDELLGRASVDHDVVVGGDPRRLARELGRRAGAHSFALSEAFGAWRVVARDRSWQIDLTPIMGGTIEDDLARRDLTINAIARPLAGGPAIDPHGGTADLRARLLRMVGPDSFSDDPLRTIRLARLAAELEFEVDPPTRAAAAAGAARLTAVSAERVFAELRQIIASDRVLDGLALMDALGATAVVLPELTALHAVQQSDYHHLDVHGHTIAVLEQTVALERPEMLEQAFGDHGHAVSELLAEPLANELTRGTALRFGALFHDAAKPQTRAVTPDGRVTFMGHDTAGAELVEAVFGRLRASERLISHVAALTRNHLRLGFLVHEAPLSRRAVYRYLRACEPVEVDVTVLSVADRLATRGRNSERAIERHIELARELIGDALAWRAARPKPPVRGDQLARAIGVTPGPELGRILAELEEAAFAGEVETEQQALERARELLGRAAPDR